MAEPEDRADKAVIVIMGGEKSILPGIKIAERFAEFGVCGLSVSLFGADGLPEGPDRIPLELFENAVRFLEEKKGIKSISTYGVSMGSLFAALIAEHIGGIENVIMVSPSHVPFEGTPDKKHMTGHSVVTWCGKELPFVNADFTEYKAMKYYRDSRTEYRVTGMWKSYRDAYADKARESEADISHLLGMMPSRRRNPILYKMIPFIGIFYRRFRDNRNACMKALEQSEKEIMEWIRNSGTGEGG